MNFIKDSIQMKSILEQLSEPVLLNEFIDNWNILHWSLNDWESKLQDTFLPFRKNYFIKSKDPIWEKTCSSESMRIKDFIKFQSNDNNDYWVYFDYKYMNVYFEEHKEILESIQWSNLGYTEKTGKDSTIWIGSKGAHTPCHMDTYGCNLIAQVYGRKRWIMFPPEENLHPTRVPYEESSVYSKLNFFYPDLNDFKGVSNARTVILNHGDVLFLPAGWWHYVENLETAISVNMWIPLPQDDRKRIEETMSQIFVSQILKETDETIQSSILNPDSKFILEDSMSQYLEYLEKIIKKYNTDTEQSVKKQKNNETPSTDFMSSNVKVIPKLSDAEFITLLREQQSKYNFTKQEQIKSNSTEIFEKIINAVCHPEVLSIVADKLLKD